MKVIAACLLVCLMVAVAIARPNSANNVEDPVGSCTTVGQLLLDGSNCHIYYQCVYDRFNNLLPEERICDNVMCLDLDLQVCDTNACSRCETSTIVPPYTGVVPPQ